MATICCTDRIETASAQPRLARRSIRPRRKCHYLLLVALAAVAVPIETLGQRPELAPARQTELLESTEYSLTPAEPLTDAQRREVDADVRTGGPRAESASPGEVSPAEPSTTADLIRAAYRLARAAETVPEYTQAINYCRKALHDPKLPAPHRNYTRQLAAWIFNKRGESVSKQAAESMTPEAELEREQAALADFDQSIELNANAWRAWHNRGVSRAVLGRYEDALADFNAALERNERYKNTWFNRGEVYYQLGQFAEAVNDYGQAIRLDPNDADAYASRGHALFRQGKMAESLADFDKVLRLRPDDAVAHVDRADAYTNLGEWSRAAADYRVAIQLDKGQARAYRNAAWLMATCPDEEFQNPQLAIRAARRAIELDGEADHRAYDILAAAQASAGDFAAAETAIRQAIHVAPNDLAEPLQRRLELYSQRQPYRQAAAYSPSSAHPDQTEPGGKDLSEQPASFSEPDDDPVVGSASGSPRSEMIVIMRISHREPAPKLR